MKPILKKVFKVLLVLFLLLLAAGLVVYWRLSTVTITPLETALEGPVVTIETERFKIDLPDYLFEVETRGHSLEWADTRLVFWERVFGRPEEAEASFQNEAKNKRNYEIFEDVSPLFGQPALLRGNRGKDGGFCRLNREPFDPDFCPGLTLKIYYPQGFILLTQYAGRDYAPPAGLGPDRRSAYLEAKKDLLLQLAQDFLPNYTWLEKSEPSPDQPGYRTGAGFIRKTGSESYRYTLAYSTFISNSHSLAVDIRSERATAWDLFDPDEADKWAVISQAFLRTGKLRAHNYYPFKAGAKEGLEMIGIQPYFSKKPWFFKILWQEKIDSDQAEKYVQTVTMQYDGDDDDSPGEIDRAAFMGLWRAILNTLQFKDAGTGIDQ